MSNEDNKTDRDPFPDDMDSALDASFDAIEPKDDRTPTQKLIGEVGKGAASALTTPKNYATMIEKALPESYGEAYSIADSAVTTLKGAYSTSAKEVKKGLTTLAKTVRQVLPKDSFLGTHLDEFISDNEEYSGKKADEGKQRDDAIAASLGEIFGAQQADQAEADKKERAESYVEKQVQTNRYKTEIGVLGSIDKNILALRQYQDKINAGFQRKSLELQFRSYHVLSDTLRQLKLSHAEQLSEAKLVVKNTALPDFLKITKMEAFKEHSRNKFFDRLTGGLFKGASEFIEGFSKNIGSQISGKLNQAANAFFSAATGIEDIHGMKDSIIQNEDMENFGQESDESDEFKLLKFGVRTGAEMGVENLMTRFGKWVRSQYENTDTFKKMNNPIANFVTDPTAYLRQFKSSRQGELANDDTWYKKLYNAIIYNVKSAIPNMQGDRTIESDQLNTLHKERQLSTNQTYKSINEIIPGYLARILQSSERLRLQTDKVRLTDYSFKSNRFMDRAEIRKEIRTDIIDPRAKESYNRLLDDVINRIDPEKQLSEEDQNALKTFFSIDTLHGDKARNYRFQELGDSKVFTRYGLNEETAQRLAAYMTARYGKDASLENKSTEADIRGRIASARHYVSDKRGHIQAYQNLGYGDILREEGYTVQDKDNLSVRYDDAGMERNYREKMPAREKPPGPDATETEKSDWFSKERFKAFSPGEALQKIKSLGISKWRYKPGKAERPELEGEQAGPSAQDTRAKFGDEAAPDGKRINMVAMNGYNQEAIKELDERYQKVVDVMLNVTETIKNSAVFNQAPQAAKGLYSRITSAAQRVFQKSLEAGDAENIKLDDQDDRVTMLLKSQLRVQSKLFRLNQKAYKEAKAYQEHQANFQGPGAGYGMPMAYAHGHPDTVMGHLGAMFGSFGSLLGAGGRNIAEWWDEPSALIPKLKTGAGWAYDKAAGAASFVSDKAGSLIDYAHDTIYDRAGEIRQKFDVYLADEIYPRIDALKLANRGYYKLDEQGNKIYITQLSDIDGTIYNKDGTVAIQIQEIKDAYARIQASGKDRWLKVYDLVGASTRATWDKVIAAKDTVKRVLGDKIGSTWQFMKDTADRFADRMDRPCDIHAYGYEEPILYAVTMRNGGYISKRTGKPVERPSEIDGVILDEKGNEVLTRDHLDAGLHDPMGIPITGKYLRAFRIVKNHAFGLARWGWKKLVDLKDNLKEKAVGLLETIGQYSPIKLHTQGLGISLGVGSFTSTNDLLYDIRDLLMQKFQLTPSRKPQATEDVAPKDQKKYSVKTSVAEIKRHTGEKLKLADQKRKNLVSSAKSWWNTLRGKESGAEEFVGPPAPQPEFVGPPSPESMIMGPPKPTMMTKIKSKVRRITNDFDGDGIRDGSWLEKFREKRKQRAAERAQAKEDQKIAKQTLKESPKAIAGLSSAVAGLSTIWDGMKDLGGLGMDAASTYASIKTAKNVKDAAVAAGAVAETAAAAAGTVGAAEGVAAGAAGAGAATTIAKKPGMLRRVAGAVNGFGSKVYKGAGILLKGMAQGSWWVAKGTAGLAWLTTKATTILGKFALFKALPWMAKGAFALGGGLLTGIGAVLAAPVVGPLAALATAAWTAYDIYKYATRNSLDWDTKYRYAQYGFDPEDTRFVSKVFALEDFLLDKHVTMGRRGAEIGEIKDEDARQVLDLFGVDPNNEEALSYFYVWYQRRFKTVFINTLNTFQKLFDKPFSAYSNLREEERTAFLKACEFPEGPYDLIVSPTTDLAFLPAGPDRVASVFKEVMAERQADDPQGYSIWHNPLLKTWDVTKRAASATWEFAKSVVTGAWDGVKWVGGKISDGLDSAAKFLGFYEGWYSIKEAVSDLGDTLTSWTKIKDKVGNFFNAVIDIPTAFIRRSLGGDVTALESIRYRAYGLDVLARFKVLSLRGLENYVDQGIKLSKDGVATYDFKEKTLLLKMQHTNDFPLPKPEDKSNFLIWFQARFLPVYLTYRTRMEQEARNARAEDDLNPAQLYNVATAIEEVAKNVVGVTASPWPDQALATSLDKISFFVNQLKSKIKQEDLPDAAYSITKAQAQGELTDREKQARDSKPIDMSSRNNSKELNDYRRARPLDSNQFFYQGEDSAASQDQDRSVTVKSIGDEKINLSKPKIASGPLSDGTKGMSYIQLAKDSVDIRGLNPAVLRNLMAMAQEYGEATGNKIIVNAGKRSYEEQQRQYNSNPGKAAKPGTSLHEFGLAVDINSTIAEDLDKLGLMKKYGFTRPVGGEPWHMEPAAIGLDIDRAKKDPVYASNVTLASRGHGGGGYGTSSSANMGARNIGLAQQIFNSDGQEVNLEAGGDPKKIPSSVMAEATTLRPKDINQLNQSGSPSSSPSTGQPGSQSSGQATSPPANTSGISEGESRPNMGSGTPTPIDKLPVPQGSGPKAVMPTLEAASKATGVPTKTLATVTAIESGFNPNAQAGGGSTAKGLLQLTDPTWNDQLKRKGSQYGITASTSPFDARANAILGAEYLKDNAKQLEGMGRPVDDTSLYASYFLGASGAKKLFSADPKQSAPSVLPQAASANRAIFYNQDSARTVSEVTSFLDDKVKKKAQEFGIGGSSWLTDAPKAMNDKSYKLTSDKPAASAPAASTPASTSAPSSPAPAARSPAPETYRTYVDAPKPPPSYTQPQQSPIPQVDLSSTNKILTSSLETQNAILAIIRDLVQHVSARTNDEPAGPPEPDNRLNSVPTATSPSRTPSALPGLPISLARRI